MGIPKVLILGISDNYLNITHINTLSTTIMTTLTVPSSGTINYIHAIADIHVRNDDHSLRNYEYLFVFENLINHLKNHPHLDQSVVVIAGDVFHTRGTSLANTFINAATFIKKLSLLAPVYIIAGNHDINYIHDPNAKDMIDAVITIMTMLGSNHNIHYLCNTGTYFAGNVGFSVVSVKDMIQPGTINKLVDPLPPFPNEFPSHITHKIALCHGNFTNTLLQNYNPSNNGLPLDWITLPLAILGDIHLPQSSSGPFTLDCLSHPFQKNKLTWAYSGSLIQQNFGESPFLHGYHTWDLINSTINMNIIPNNTIRINTKLVHQEWVIIDKNEIPVTQLVHTLQYTPTTVLFRTRGLHTIQDTLNIIQLLKDQNINNVIHMTPSNQNNNQQATITENNNTFAINDLDEINTPSTWINYIQQNSHNTQFINEWVHWINDPDLLIIPSSESLPSHIQTKIIERNKEINKLINSFTSSSDQTKINGTFKILSIEAHYFLCYDHLVLNFESLDYAIALIRGLNGVGKSTIFEAIITALYGLSVQSRLAPSNTKDGKTTSVTTDCTSLVHNQHNSKLHGKPFIKMTFMLNDVTFCIFRDIKSDSGSYKYDNVYIKCVSHLTSLYPDVPKTKTSDWVTKNIGDVNAFILGAMSTQYQDANYFDMSPENQILKINTILNFDHLTNIIALLNECNKDYNFILKELQSSKLTIIDNTSNNSYNKAKHESLLQNKIDLEIEIKDIQTLLQNLRTTFHSIPLHDLSDSMHSEHNITLLQRQRNNIKPVKSSRDSLIAQKGALDDILQNITSIDFQNVLPYSLHDTESTIQSYIESVKELEDIIDTLTRDLQIATNQHHSILEEISRIPITWSHIKDTDLMNTNAINIMNEFPTQPYNKSDLIEQSGHLRELILDINHDLPAYHDVELLLEQNKHTLNDRSSELEKVQHSLSNLRAQRNDILVQLSHIQHTWNDIHSSFLSHDNPSFALDQITLQIDTDESIHDLTCLIGNLQSQISYYNVTRDSNISDPGPEPAQPTEKNISELLNTTKDYPLLSNNDSHELLTSRKSQLDILSKLESDLSNKLYDLPDLATPSIGYDDAALHIKNTIESRKNASKNTKTLSELEDFFHQLQSHDSNCESALIRMQTFQTDLDNATLALDNIPFNPDCDACRCQPARIHLASLQLRYDESKSVYDTFIEARKKFIGRKDVDKRSAQFLALQQWTVKHNLLNRDYDIMVNVIDQWKSYNDTKTQRDDIRKQLDDIRSQRTILSQQIDTLHKSLLRAHAQEQFHLHTSWTLWKHNSDVFHVTQLSQQLHHVRKQLDLIKERDIWKIAVDSKPDFELFNQLTQQEQSIKKSIADSETNEVKLSHIIKLLLSKQNELLSQLQKARAHLDGVNALSQLETIQSTLATIEKREYWINVVDAQPQFTLRTQLLEESKLIHVDIDHLRSKLDDIKHQYTRDCEQLITYQNMLLFLETNTKLDCIKTQLDNLEILSNIDSHIEYWTKVHSVIPNFIKTKELQTKLDQLQADLLRTVSSLGSFDYELNQQNRTSTTVTSLQDFSNTLQQRADSTKALSEAFRNYRSWVLREKIVPHICTYVNDIVNNIHDHGDELKLHGTVREDGHAIDWRLQNNGHLVYMNKCGGFQKFIFSLAMKIALGHLGGRTAKFRQIFIDEGFVSCDSSHMANVPKFLECIASLYDSVIIVSHVDIIKDCADIVVDIKRNGNFSTLIYGVENTQPLLEARGRGRGRGHH